MAKKARQRISYILDLPNSSPGGHKLGVNGLTIDRDNAILYSGGRDGVICAWDLNFNPSSSGHSGAAANGVKAKNATKFRGQVQAHSQWINDLAVAQNHSAVVSASIDMTVKVWRPHDSSQSEPATIGQHADFAKCVATPDQAADWVASGGLDRMLYLWDLSGKGKISEIDVSGEEKKEKGSVYALAVNHHILANGGPEQIVRLWDPKSGKRIAKFVGHTGMIRSILLNQAGDTVMTASSDQTIKVWSITAGRCMHTLTMHNDSVWALYSEDPDLGVFYSSDRSGLVVKTDIRDALGEVDDGISLAIAQENEGVHRVVAWGDYLWTSTSSSSINRWPSPKTGLDAPLPQPFTQYRAQRASELGKEAVATHAPQGAVNGTAPKEISPRAILRISNTASFPAVVTQNGEANPPDARKGSEVVHEHAHNVVEPINQLPEETIEGQFGLVKHRLLNDRRRVLTLDTAGDVLLWDLIKCEPIQSFGKRHMEDVEPETNTVEAVAPWCSIDTSSGTLTVVLDPFNCFDAEMYADELVLDEHVEFRDDQRINLGKWILRYLFANVIDEEIKRDEAHRQKLNDGVEKRIAAAAAAVKATPPTSISIPPPNLESLDRVDSAITPRANGAGYPPTTPGLGIGVATPGAMPSLPEHAVSPTSPLDKRASQVSRPSVEKEDYFSNAIQSAADINQAAKPAVTPAAETPAETKDAKTPVEAAKDKDKEKDKEKDSKGTPFGKKFKIGMSFGSKKIGRSTSNATAEKPVVVDEVAEESESSSNHEKEFDDSFLGVIQKVQHEYEKALTETPDKIVETKITPSLSNDTPVLKLPPNTKVFIQEETSGGMAELYRGTIETVGSDVDVIEKVGPHWLGEVLLLNAIPPKEPTKVSFVLHPWGDSLPGVSTADGNNRLNANRMLRVKKILSYVAEKIDPTPEGEEPDPNALKPEEYLELYCNEQLLPITMTLATLRAHIWKGGNDVVLYYKANGKKEIKIRPPDPPPAEPEQAAEPPAPAPAPTAA